MLGISASTYDYYESRRVPPADVLVRIADVAGVDLRWLLTGDEAGGSSVPAAHPVLQRAAALLARRPDSAQPLGAFLEILAASLKFPAKGEEGRAHSEAPGGQAEPDAGQSRVQQVATNDSMTDGDSTRRIVSLRTPIGARPANAPPTPAPAQGGSAQSPVPESLGEPAHRSPAGEEEGREGWIPILGRSAAGVPQFWAREDDASGVKTLGELVARQGDRRPARVDLAAASGLAFGAETLLDAMPQDQRQAPREPLRDLPVQIVTLEGPDEGDVAEYVASKEMKARYGDAFAVRIDGESMSPEIRHGDLVVLSPSVPAAQGRPAVVQLRRQIGVTCKLYRREAHAVHLVPVNEQFSPQTFPDDRVAWALRVLATIRPIRP